MTRLGAALESAVTRVERLAALDRPTEALATGLRRLVPPGLVRDAASGTPLGHPAHPMLVTLPIGAFAGASVLDLTHPRRGARAGRALVGFGLLTALPAAYAGMSDWLDTDTAERRVGAVHAATNAGALLLYVASWRARRRERRFAGPLLGLAGGGLLTTGGWLGGHLTYAMGVGVDTTAFQQFPAEWTDVAAVADLLPGKLVRATAGDTALLLVRTERGVTALAGRCSHRGGPLDEGELRGNRVVCPWHGSEFDVHDGAICGGPASRPQAVLEARERAGRIEVRRPAEPRSLRTNPV